MNNMPTKYNVNQVAIQGRPILPMMPTMDEMRDIVAITRALADTPFYGKLGPGGVLAIWLTARELRLPPMMCLNGGLHNIEGKVQMSAQLMNMMILNAGHEVEVVYSTNKGCKLRFIRNFTNGKKPKIDEFEYNETDAREAQVFGVKHANGTFDPKPKTNWIKFPRSMYYSRAMSGGGKMFMSDVLMNVYAMGEIYDVEEKYVESEARFVDSEISETTAQTQIEAQKEPEKPKMTENDVEAFKEAFGIGSESKHEKYIEAIANRCKKSKDEMIILASMNREGFVEAFEKWESDIKKKNEIAEDSKPVGDSVESM